MFWELQSNRYESWSETFFILLFFFVFLFVQFWTTSLFWSFFQQFYKKSIRPYSCIEYDLYIKFCKIRCHTL